MTAFVVLTVLVLSSVSWTGAVKVYKLETDSKPISYIIHLEPDIMESQFKGSVIIDFVMEITSSVVVLNQKNLHIREVEIEGKPLRKWVDDHGREVLIIYCAEDLMNNHHYRLKITYDGILQVSERGFYKSRYKIGNETSWIAATHFEATGARLAFPCWDEPMYKAFFNISIKHSSKYTTVLSNMPILNKTHNADDTITTYFHRTMLMSTYLVAFVISDYVYKSYDDHRFKIFTKPESLHQTELAYNFSVEAMKVMDEYTEIPYFNITTKMDQVTIRDFIPNAMENWGLVTYGENFLLYEEGISTSTDKYNVITTIAHEFAHQWFGNLVSPQWWQYLWLNEGFATYFQYFIIEKVKPSWRLVDLFSVEIMQNVFITDGKKSRPINQNADHPREIAALFDTISYDKAGCVIRMLAHILTEQVFHTGLKNYLRENSFSVADSDNLIKHLQHAAGENKTWDGVALSEIVRTWIMESGYPMVTVKETSPRHYTLSQKHFSYYTADKEKSWWIPITYATNRSLNFADTSVTHWMNPEVSNLTILEPETDWILLNKQRTGYYRVNYDDALWQKLTQYLKSSSKMHRIHPVNRAQLIDDALAMAHINHTKYETAMSLTLYLHREIDYIPWMTTFQNLEFLRHKVFPSRHYDIFKHYIRYIMHSLTKNLTFVASPKDDQPTKVLRSNAMKWACIADVKECVDEAHKEFNAWLKDPNHRLDPDLRITILCTGLRDASEEVWDEALKKLSQETFDIGRKTSPLKVLGCSNNRTILHKFLIYSGQSDSNIRFETAARAVLENTNVTGVQIVQYILDFELQKIMRMQQYYDQISSVIKYLTATITNNEDFLMLSKFVVRKRGSDPSVIGTVSQSMKNIKWIASYGRIIDRWLLKNEELFKSSATGETFVSLLLILSILNMIAFKIFL